jgi:hypothetical protein
MYIAYIAEFYIDIHIYILYSLYSYIAGATNNLYKDQLGHTLTYGSINCQTTQSDPEPK